MGLLSLRDKIGINLQKRERTEEDVLYALIEITKYAERSDKEDVRLRNPPELRVRRRAYPIIRFFRNWAAHPLKDHEPAPKDIILILDKVRNGTILPYRDRHLFVPLHNEVARFAADLNLDVGYDREGFEDALMRVLSEQILKPDNESRWLQYNEALDLCELAP